MHLKKMLRVWAACAGVLGLGVTLSVTPETIRAQEKKEAPMATVDKTGAVVVTIGGQSRFQMKSKKRIKEAFNENDRVVSVLPDATDPTTLILLGRAAGTSKLEITDIDGGKENYLIVVQRDMELLRNLIKKTVPTAAVEVTPIGDNGTNIILTGYTVREEDRDSIKSLAEALNFRVAVNHVTVGGGGNVPHVQLDLTLANVDRTRARARGASFIVNGGTVSGGSILGGLGALQQGGGGAVGAQTVGLIPSASSVAAGQGANLIAGIIPSQFLLLMSCLKTEGLAKLVAAPTVVARSGEQAELLVGQSVPVISAAAGINGPGVTYRPVGTELRVLPIVYGNGKIHLTVEPRVTSVSTTQALATGFGTSPAFDEQRMITSVIAEPGQTIAIGGLIQSTTQGSVTKVPFLGDIPFVGAFFSFATQQEQEIELVILITPRLIDPADSCQMPKPLPGSESRKPDDFEFYMETMLEAPRGQRVIWEGHNYKPAWMSSPSASTYPCAGGVGGVGGNCAGGSCPAPAGTVGGSVGTSGSAPPIVPASLERYAEPPVTIRKRSER
jgi:pilus assembly protein CpaC